MALVWAVALWAETDPRVTEVMRLTDVSPSEAIVVGESYLRDLPPETSLEVRLNLEIAIGTAEGDFSQFEEASARFERVEAEARRAGADVVVADVMNRQAVLRWLQSDLLGAADRFEEALEWVREKGLDDRQARLLSNLGAVFGELGDLGEELRLDLKVQELDEQFGATPDERATTLNNIATIYLELGEYEQALATLERTLALWQEAGSDQGIATVLNNRGEVLRRMGQNAEAVSDFEASLAMRQNLENWRGVASCYLGLASLHGSMNDPEAAELAFEAGWTVSQKHELTFYLARLGARWGEWLADRGRWEQLDAILATAIPAGEASGAFPERLALRRLAARLAEARGDWVGALKLEREADVLREEMLNEERVRSLALQQIRYDTAEKERSIAALQGERAAQEFALVRERLWRNQLLAGAASILLILILLYSRYRLKTRANAALRTARDQLATLNAEKSALLRLVAHDLKTPIANIRWIAGLLRDQSSSQPAVAGNDGLALIEETASGMLHQVMTLLEAERIESGALFQPGARSDAEAVLRERLKSLKPQLERKKLQLEWVEGRRLTEVAAGREALEHIFDNLLGNAVKFSPSSTSIRVRTAVNDRGWLFSVRDEGPGLTAEDRSRLFRKFEPLSAKPTGGESSNGLGLAIVKSLVDGLNGLIEVESEPGAGALFRVVLPLAPENTERT